MVGVFFVDVVLSDKYELVVRRALEDLALVQALVQQVDPSECQTLRNQSSSDNLPSAVRDSHKFEEGHC